MINANRKVAIVYDFDGTLAPGNMQEHSFLLSADVAPEDFWQKSFDLQTSQDADPITAYMYLMLEYAKLNALPLRKEDFVSHGHSIPLFPGLDSWFRRVNGFADELGLGVEHVVVSSGLRELIEGTEIAEHFSDIYASGFLYDEFGHARGAATAVNYTNKTQFLFRINRGVRSYTDHKGINDSSLTDSSVPFENMIYIGDGETDIPCLSITRERGGTGILVYNEQESEARRTTIELFRAGRADHAFPADYSEGSGISEAVRLILEIISRRARLSEI